MIAVATLLRMTLTCVEGKLMISIGCLQAATDMSVPEFPLHLIILRVE